ncbi:MFS transporter [Halorubrum lacusprofundi]|uniref:Major facilitator superfamily MFS_1 n=1 Tax=Halorubrum lacusprofundi (strain ATCC 49239 / DSM 5036 / JCM 8891 / ACAM 34) TaxID=416348 RepID=B9LQE1_HALLT|nr:MFS transporter [Halorubrum lacusprofundi]ACM57562.1 major facilitator superfamily MFS_1 [Halorubrum lacusprofundi ATCC 49239]MCG1005841.1 MFS transporter [Halorubrum lacusprofundi]
MGLLGIDRPPTVLLAVIASTFFVGFGGGVVFPILPNLGAVLGISAFMVGVILSANRWVRLVANAPAGALVDRYGTRKPFVAGLFVEGVATLGYVVALAMPPAESLRPIAASLPTFAAGPLVVGAEQWFTPIAIVVAPETWFLLARILWGFGSAAVFATAYTIAADLSDSGSRGTNMGVVRGGITMGFPAGLVLGGVVSAIAGNIAAFSVAAAFALTASVVAYRYVPETHVTGDRSGDSIKPWDIDTAVPAVTVGLVNFGLMFAYIGALFSTLVLFLGANDISLLGLAPQGTSGLFMAGTVLSAAFFMLVGGRISDTRDSRTPILLTFLVVSFVGFLLLARAESVVSLGLACIFIGAGQGGTSGPMMALLADLTPDERMGRASGTNNVLGDVGGGLGPMVSLPLIESVGFAPIYAACAILPLAAGAALLVGVRRETGTFLPGRTAGETDPGEGSPPTEP